MRFRWLAGFPLLYALAFLLIAGYLLDSSALQPFLAGQRLLVRLLSLAGCSIAVSAFERGDHLRKAWLVIAVSTFLLLLRDWLQLFPPPGFPAPATHAGSQALIIVLVVISNFLLLYGTWELARSWKMAAIALPGGRMAVVGVTLVTAALALALAGPGALQNAHRLVEGNWRVLGIFVSAVVDILSLCLISPLLFTALALRGGLFSWPWALLAANLVSWLLFDTALAFSPLVAPSWSPLFEVFRGMAMNFLAAAGLAQWLVIRQVHRRVADPIWSRKKSGRPAAADRPPLETSEP